MLSGATATFTCSTAPLFSCHVNEYVLQGLPGQREGEPMFEGSQEAKSSASMGMWTGVGVVALAISIGGYMFIAKAKSTKPVPVAASQPAQPTGPADVESRCGAVV